MNFFRKLHQAINNTLAAPGRFIEAANALSSSVQEQTRTVEALRTDVLKALGVMSSDSDAHHQELAKHVKYMAVSEQKRNQREGRPHAFKD